MFKTKFNVGDKVWWAPVGNKNPRPIPCYVHMIRVAIGHNWFYEAYHVKFTKDGDAQSRFPHNLLFTTRAECAAYIKSFNK